MAAMVSFKRTVFLVAAALPLLLWAAELFAQEGWWNYTWPYRRELTVADVPQTGLEGDEIGVATMPTGGLTKPDASDLVVVASGGTVVPHRVLMVGPGDRVRFAFALKSPITHYAAYFGNADPPKPAPQLQIKRGVLQETWEYKAGGVRTLQQARLTLEKPGELIGRDFRPQVFQGLNPFGPQDKICTRYTAYLNCTKEGEYTFSTSSQDASFVVVDGNEVVDNGGIHPPQRRAVRSGTAALKKGLHEVVVYHISGGGDPVITLAWQEPGGNGFKAIPPEAFTPVRQGRCGLTEAYGKTTHADFLPVQAGESFVNNRYYQRYSFEALIRQNGSSKPDIKWDFGDGQTSSAAKIDHVFLHDGPFKVTLTVQAAGETVARANTLYVTRPWAKVAQNELDNPADQAKLIAAYDFSAASPADLGAAIDIFNRCNQPAPLLRAGEALLKQKTAPPAVLRDVAPVYAKALARQGGDPGKAVEALSRAAAMTDAPIVASQLTLQAGQTALQAGQVDKALGFFDEVLRKFSATSTPFILQQAHGGRGGVFRARGEYERAKAEYLQAALAGGDLEKQSVRKGDLARHAEDYIRTQAYEDAADALQSWAEEFPLDLLEGYWSLLKVKLALAQKQPSAAAAEAEILVKVNPASNYAPELLMLWAQACEAMGQPGQARSALQMIADKYAESSLAAQAREKLAAPASGPTSRPASAPAPRPASAPASRPASRPATGMR
jgi:tetratricopeptide (TPR) repeat protein